MPDTRTDKKQYPIIVIAGRDESLVDAECDRLLDRLIEPSQRATSLFRFESDQLTAAQVLDELRTLPFLSEKKVVLIKGAEKFISANRAILEEYFDKPSATGILVMTVGTWDSRTKLAKKLRGVGKLITCTQPKTGELPGRLMRYCSESHSKKLTRSAVELLIELTGTDLSRLYSEIDKLALFADTSSTITDKHVEALIGHNRLFNAFNVIDACLAGNSAQAVDRLRAMFAADKSAEYTAVGAFAYHLRQMFNAKAMLQQGLDAGEAASKLKIWGNREQFFRQVRAMPLEKIGGTLGRLADIDYAIKTGRRRARTAIEELVLELATQYGKH